MCGYTTKKNKMHFALYTQSHSGHQSADHNEINHNSNRLCLADTSFMSCAQSWTVLKSV